MSEAKSDSELKNQEPFSKKVSSKTELEKQTVTALDITLAIRKTLGFGAESKWVPLEVAEKLHGQRDVAINLINDLRKEAEKLQAENIHLKELIEFWKGVNESAKILKQNYEVLEGRLADIHKIIELTTDHEYGTVAYADYRSAQIDSIKRILNLGNGDKP